MGEVGGMKDLLEYFSVAISGKVFVSSSVQASEASLTAGSDFLIAGIVDETILTRQPPISELMVFLDAAWLR